MNFIGMAIIVILVIGILGGAVIWLINRKKAKVDHQPIILLKEDNSIVDLNLEIYYSMATDKNKKQPGEMNTAYLIDTSNQVWDPLLGGYVQVNTERDVAPLRLFGEEPQKFSTDMIDSVADQVTDDEINYALNKRNNLSHLNKLGWVAIILGLVLAGEVIAKLHMSGVF